MAQTWNDRSKINPSEKAQMSIILVHENCGPDLAHMCCLWPKEKGKERRWAGSCCKALGQLSCSGGACILSPVCLTPHHTLLPGVFHSLYFSHYLLWPHHTPDICDPLFVNFCISTPKLLWEPVCSWVINTGSWPTWMMRSPSRMRPSLAAMLLGSIWNT